MMARDWIRELRDMYPTTPTLEFVRIVEEHRDSQQLLDILDRAEAQAVAEKNRADRALRELRERLSVGEQHYGLKIEVDPEIDLEHAQAILAYAFLMPGQKTVYAGANVIAAENVLHNTRNKLPGRFSEQKFEAALQYLVREGVVCAVGTKSRRAYSVNLCGRSFPDGSRGRQILQAVQVFARSKHVGAESF